MRPEWIPANNVLPIAPEYPSEIGEAIELYPNALVPDYLSTHYWWAYIHPKAVKLFERQWLVNLILWGNYARLRDAALAEMGELLSGRTLQVACAYGDLTNCLSQRATIGGGSIDIVDVLPIQLKNLRGKLPVGAPARLLAMDAIDLKLPDASYDRVLVFFLLHEQPREWRERTLSEVLRVVKPGERSLSSTMRGRAGGIRCATSFRSCLRSLSRLHWICGGKKSPVGCWVGSQPARISDYSSADFINWWWAGADERKAPASCRS